MSRSVSATILFISALAFAACTGDRMAGPSSASNTNGDTTQVAASVVNLSGHVYAIQSAPPGGSDTLAYSAIAGVQLKLMHNVLVNGVATQELTGSTVSDANGAYHFDGIDGGYYVIYATPSVASGYKGNYSLVPAQSATTVVDVFVWKAQ